jgi:hypothetical protein
LGVGFSENSLRVPLVFRKNNHLRMKSPAHPRQAPTPQKIVIKCDQTNTPPTTPKRNPSNRQKSPKNVSRHPPGAIAGACNTGCFRRLRTKIKYRIKRRHSIIGLPVSVQVFFL